MVPAMDKDFVADTAALDQFLGGVEKPKTHDVEGRRRLYASLASQRTPTVPDEVQLSVVTVLTHDGAEMRILHYRHRDKALGSETEAGPAVIHMHGGGFMALTAEVSLAAVCSHVAATGVQFFSVDYRLAPEHPYPIPLEDCWTALQWVAGKASLLGVDPARIGVMGDSAGGNLAAALAILARERGLSPPIRRQILVYPMLDDRTTSAAEAGADPAQLCIWGPDDNVTAWTAYIGNKVGKEEVPATAAPARIRDVMGLPPLYIDVGQLDLFCAEGHAYAGKFLAAQIETEHHLCPGLPHGFDNFAPHHTVTRALMDNRNRQLRRLYDE